jgi:hypothetical protein
VGPVSTCRRELLRRWWWSIGLMVSFMIFTVSVRNILDRPSYQSSAPSSERSAIAHVTRYSRQFWSSITSQLSTDISEQMHSNVYLSGNILYRSASSLQELFYSWELRQVFTDARLGLGNYCIATNTDRWISRGCYRSYVYHAWTHCVCFTLIICQIIQPLSDTLYEWYTTYHDVKGKSSREAFAFMRY